MLTLVTLCHICLCTGHTQGGEGLLLNRRKLRKLDTARKVEEVLPVRKRIKRKYAGMARTSGGYNNPITRLLEKDPTFIKVSSARILRHNRDTKHGKTERKGRMINTRREHFQTERSLKHLSNIRVEQKEKVKEKEEENRSFELPKTEENPVMSVITLLD